MSGSRVIAASGTGRIEPDGGLLYSCWVNSTAAHLPTETSITMKLSELQKIRIDVVSEKKSALYMLMERDGMISRQGSGHLPVEEFTVTSDSDGSVFKQLVDVLDERVFEHTGVYDHPQKKGVPVVISVAFLDEAGESSFFEFRFGTENEDTGELLPYFDKFISHAIQLTDHWYYQEREKHNQGSEQA
jgi:hypothetical protein